MLILHKESCPLRSIEALQNRPMTVSALLSTTSRSGIWLAWNNAWAWSAGTATTVTVFLMADAVVAAKAGQKTPDGYYNIERMLKGVEASKGQILLCGTCMDARGLTEADIMTGARRSTMDELAAATVAADKVLVF
jgi:uncharacterized protein involved in oxidation of intracellular sulfur